MKKNKFPSHYISYRNVNILIFSLTFLSMGIIKLATQQPLEPEKRSLYVSHLAALSRYAERSLLLTEGDIAWRRTQGVIVGD